MSFRPPDRPIRGKKFGRKLPLELCRRSRYDGSFPALTNLSVLVAVCCLIVIRIC
jgi:hypothetical protein